MTKFKSSIITSPAAPILPSCNFTTPKHLVFFPLPPPQRRDSRSRTKKKTREPISPQVWVGVTHTRTAESRRTRETLLLLSDPTLAVTSSSQKKKTTHTHTGGSPLLLLLLLMGFSVRLVSRWARREERETSFEFSQDGQGSWRSTPVVSSSSYPRGSYRLPDASSTGASAG